METEKIEIYKFMRTYKPPFRVSMPMLMDAMHGQFEDRKNTSALAHRPNRMCITPPFVEEYFDPMFELDLFCVLIGCGFTTTGYEYTFTPFPKS